jgi:hypothetical protein
MSERKVIAVDFDGTINMSEKPAGRDMQWYLDDETDYPVSGAREWVLELCQHFTVVIHTCRAIDPDGKEAVKAWLKRWGFPELEVTPIKPIAVRYVDDRGYHFTGKNFPSVKELKGYKSWHRET